MNFLMSLNETNLKFFYFQMNLQDLKFWLGLWYYQSNVSSFKCPENCLSPSHLHFVQDIKYLHKVRVKTISPNLEKIKDKGHLLS